MTDHCSESIRPDLPRIGSPKALRLSEIRSLAPDCILSDQNENRPEEIRELQKEFRVLSFDVRSVPAVLDAVSALGRLADKISQAQKLVSEIKTEYETSRAHCEGNPPLETLLLLWNQPYLTINFDTYASRLIECCGGRNVFHEEPLREFPADLEDLIEKNPSLLLLPGDPFPFARRHIKGFRQYRVFSQIPIKLIDGHLISRFGPKTAEALRTFRNLFDEMRKDPAPA